MRRSGPTSLVIGLLAAGCAGSATVTRAPALADVAGTTEVLERPDGPDLAVLARATSALRLSLWIDAGSRDADPPQVATLAAWLAAEAGGPEVTAWVTPDATELSVPCTRTRLIACAQTLARALAHRAADPVAFAHASARLVRGRRLAVGADLGRPAERLALEALLGAEVAAGMFPLGEAEDDAQASAERVTSFLDAHYGPRRALLVAAGDADLEAVRLAVEPAFARLPHARGKRAARPALPTGAGGVRVDVADASRIALALVALDEPAGHARVAALARALAQPPARARVRAHVFPVRDGVLALARIESQAPVEAVVSQAARTLGNVRARHTSDSALAARDEGLGTLSRATGLRWSAGDAARATRADDAPQTAALGVLVAGPPGEGAPSTDPDAGLREATESRLDALWRKVRAEPSESPASVLGDARAATQLANGAHVEVAWRPGPHVATALVFGGGAALDPPLAHGRTALVASLVTRCVQSEGIEAEAVVDADVWGVALTTTRATWEHGLSRAVGCALDATPARADLTAARLELRDALGPERAPGSLRALAAELLAPACPGAFAPWGGARGLGHPGLAEIGAAWREAAVGRRASLAIVGDVPLREAIARASGWLESLPQGAPASRPASDVAVTAAEPPPMLSATDAPVLAIAAWRAASPQADPAGGLAFAVAMRALLGALSGIDVVWHDGGADGATGWAALALFVEPERLAELGTLLDAARERLDEATLGHAVETTVRANERRRTDAASRLADDAIGVARAGIGSTEPTRSSESARTLARRLRTVAASWRAVP